MPRPPKIRAAAVVCRFSVVEVHQVSEVHKLPSGSTRSQT